jgi:FkbM family methyltransferase
MYTYIRKIFHKLTLKQYRDQILYENKQQQKLLYHIKEYLFLNNPIQIVGIVKMYLPLFYVDHIQKIIYNSRDFYEIESLTFLKLHYKQFDTVIDIGTNIGNHMLYWCSELEAKKVVCFEPNDFNRSVLQKNIELNYLASTVTVHSCALGAESGKGIQRNFSLSNTGMNRVDKVSDASTANITEIKKLDDFTFDQIQFIKIDVEGFELDVLKGAAGTLTKYKPVVMIEVFDNSRQELDSLMQQYGYRSFITLEQYNTIYIPV